MAPLCAFVALLSFFSAASAQLDSSDYDDYESSSTSTSAFWTLTTRYAAFATTSVYTRGNGATTTYTFTDELRTIKSSVTPTATPTSTLRSDRGYGGLEVVYQYYGQEAVAATDLEPEYGDAGYSSTTRSSVTTTVSYRMPVTMTAPASCPTQFTVSTTASVTVPSLVQDQIKPTSTVDGSTTTYGSTTYIEQTWYLSANAAPFTSSSDYYYRYYIRSCSTPPGARSTSSYYYGGGGSSGGSNDDDSNSSSSRYSCYRYSYYCGTPLRTWIIVIASVIPGLFLLGFLESWFWFRRLMIGKSAMRFGTVCWILISLLVLCFTRMQDARSKEDQKILQEKWKNMGSGAAFKAWWKWGFRHKYPVEHLGQFSKLTVGVVPEGQPIHPAMAQTPPGFMPGPPPGAPGAPGQVYYYGPPPPGWVPTPDGQGFMPPQGYMYAPPQQAGYYGSNVSKEGTTVSTSPVSQHPAMAQQPQGQAVSPLSTSPAPPQAPQPVYNAHSAAPIPAPSPPPQGPVPAAPAPQASSNVSEAPANPAPRDASAPQLPPLKNDQNDRSLYE
ncbi:hypothetical protein HBI56_019800 [Parastagonospora nodorum]|nr:hypothetical protein HBH53_002970 [Parastagonospora nodorum]KAH3971461.1 hypothetical protein HBH51_112740 [Parastagonospora nodorum]KAH3982147.1 hypothetical protein HBH52_075860 [Parastagonospora nodorum]KAH4007608.1 hypothetical protein HBI10_006840 [Parastagonospora nodorum]KAH4023453.1 hypothetical protein HBI13_088550 [Parastagonospora nodorum]